MATQELRPDRGRDERQRVQRRQMDLTIKLGALSIAAIAGAIAVLIAVVAVGAEERIGPTAAGSPAQAADTSQAGTGSAVNGPTDVAFSVGFKGLPAEGATPSAPLRGDLVGSYGGVHPWSAAPWSATYLYADGRLIWTRSSTEDPSAASAWIEQRLTPKGVDFLRSAPSLWLLNTRFVPKGAWEDRRWRPYVPSRYAIVGWAEYQGLDPEGFLDLLPARAQDLLQGGDRVAGPGLEVTTDDARALAEILDGAGFHRTSSGDTSLGVVAYSHDVTFGHDVLRHAEPLVIELHPVLPDGRVPSST